MKYCTGVNEVKYQIQCCRWYMMHNICILFPSYIYLFHAKWIKSIFFFEKFLHRHCMNKVNVMPWNFKILNFPSEQFNCINVLTTKINILTKKIIYLKSVFLNDSMILENSYQFYFHICKLKMHLLPRNSPKTGNKNRIFHSNQSISIQNK